MMTAEKAAIQRICRLIAGMPPHHIEVTPDECECMVYRFAEMEKLEGADLRGMFTKFESKVAIGAIDPRNYLPGGRNE